MDWIIWDERYRFPGYSRLQSPGKRKSLWLFTFIQDCDEQGDYIGYENYWAIDEVDSDSRMYSERAVSIQRLQICFAESFVQHMQIEFVFDE